MENLELQVKSSVKDEQVEKLVEEKGKVTNDEIESSLNYNNLTQEEKDAIEEFNKKINVEDATQVLQYGAKAQGKISAFSDSVLEKEKTKSVGEVGNLLSDLVGEIKSFSTEIDNSNATGLAKLFNNAKKQLTKIVAKYSKVEVNIDRIEKELEKHKLQMLKDITIFDTMYEKNLEYFKELSLYIIIPIIKIYQLKAAVFIIS